MSTFIAFESFAISLGASIQNVQDTFEAAMSSHTYQILRRAKVPQAVLGTIATPANALDMVDTTAAGSNVLTLPLWLGVQMPAAFTPTSMTITGELNAAAQAPKDFTLEYSDNGTAWTVLQSWSNEVVWTPFEKRRYTVTGAGAHAYWRLNVSTTGGGYLYILDWTLEDAAGNRITTNQFIDMVPPATETIGSTDYNEILRWEFGANYVRFRSVPNSKTGVPQAVYAYNLTAGAVAPWMALSNGAPFNITASGSSTTLTVTAASGTIGLGSLIIVPGYQGYVSAFGTGSGGPGTYTVTPSMPTIASTTMQALPVATVTGPVGAAGNTASQNLRALYEAIRASADATFTSFTWEYQRPASQNAEDTNDYILGVRNTATNNVWCAVGNVKGGILNSAAQAGTASVNTSYYGVTTMTTDLVNGFIYYLQVCSRGIALATKTNAAFYGPIHACYADNAKANAATPPSGWGIKCAPIELIIGYDDIAANLGSTGRASHMWSINYSASPSMQNIIATNNSAASMFGKGFPRWKMVDFSFGQNSYADLALPLLGSNMFSGSLDYIGNDFQIHRMSTVGETTAQQGSVISPVAGSSYTHVTAPILDIQDWYKFAGTATDEALLMVADTVTLTNAVGNIGAADTVINVTSTAGFQSAGTICIENEIIPYTGITSTSFTGCTRGAYGTTAANHFNGDAVAAGLWFVKINGGALFCGYTKPA